MRCSYCGNFDHYNFDCPKENQLIESEEILLKNMTEETITITRVDNQNHDGELFSFNYAETESKVKKLGNFFELQKQLEEANEVINFYAWNSPVSENKFVFSGHMKICSAKTAAEYLTKYPKK